MVGNDNTYLTGLEVYHSPTPGEAATHYTDNGGAEDFAKRYVHPAEYYKELEKEIKKWLNNPKMKHKNSSSITENKSSPKTV